MGRKIKRLRAVCRELLKQREDLKLEIACIAKGLYRPMSDEEWAKVKRRIELRDKFKVGGLDG